MTAATTTGRRDFARQLHAWGAAATAIKAGTKRPGHKWERWQTQPQTRAEVDGLPWGSAAAVGVVNGSGGFRIFDIDAAKDADGRPIMPVPESVVVELLQALGLPDDYQWSYRSGSGAGWGVVVRCAETLPDEWAAPKGVYVGQPLDGRPFGQLELRWATGQTVIDGAHPTGPGYQWRRGERPFVPPAMRTAAEVAAAFAAIAERPTLPAAPSPSANGSGARSARGAPAPPMEKYAAAALADAIRQVSTAAPGNRNMTLFKQAAALAELVNGGALARTDVERGMTGAALAAGLPADETAATVASAFAHVGTAARTPKPKLGHDGSPSANGRGPANGNGPATGAPRFAVGDAVNVVISGQLQTAEPATVTAVHAPVGGEYGYDVRLADGATAVYAESNLEAASGPSAQAAAGPGANGATAGAAGQVAGKTTQGGATTRAAVFKLDDIGNAERFVTQHGDDVRYDHSTGNWLLWAGTHWRQDDDGAALRLAKATARAVYDEAAAAAKAGDDGRASDLAKWARASAAEARLRAVLNLARAERPIAVTHEHLNRHDLLLNVQNGTLDLATGQLRAHDRGDLLTYVLPAPYDPAAVAPTWERFIERITNGDGDLARFLARAVGYTLSGATTEQCLFFLYGRGANGKSTFIETVLALLGDLGHKARAAVLMADERGRVPNEVAALAGRRLVVASELADGGRLNEGLIKDLTGGDTMSARFLYGEPFAFKPTFKLWLYGNHKPTIAGTDDGIWRRVRLIPFTVQIPEGERDPALPAKLRAELLGLLAWAIRGWQDFQRGGLGAPSAVTQATAEYRAESDTLGQFLAECCHVAQGATARGGELYAAYTAWAEQNGLRRPLSNVRFGRALSERGFTNDRDTRGVFWQGVGLLATP